MGQLTNIRPEERAAAVAAARGALGAHRRRVPRLAGKAAGAVTGQLSQALGSFIVQALAARELGAGGLGVFALMYGAILLGTAVSSGLIGDSLTVLNRHSRPTRAALQYWCVLVSTGAGIVAVTAAVISGAVSVVVGLVFGLVTVVFIVEDVMRRALMAAFRFWRLPIVDGTSLLFSLTYLGGLRIVGAEPTVGQFLVALLLGQAAAVLVAVPLLPASERPIFEFRSPQMAQVFRFGAWRAAQQSVRPGLLTAARLVVTLLVGVAAYGHVEAARVYMAPAMLVVSGIGSMMLPLWVRGRHEGLARLLRRADAAAGGLFVATLLVGAIGTALLPLMGSLITGGAYRIQAAAVLGWAVYAAGTASVTPYGTLAAIQGKQGRVVLMRLVELGVGLLVLVLALAPLGLSATATPYALAIGALASGLGIRLLILPRQLAAASGAALHGARGSATGSAERPEERAPMAVPSAT